jgi:hypothetical protein
VISAMAYSLERLVDPQGRPITPAESDLAFYMSADGMHGYAESIPSHIRYWQGQRKIAQDYVEPAREGAANQIVAWLTLDGAIRHPNDIARMALFNSAITPEVIEGYRRYVIGGLAMSLALRRGLAVNFKTPITDVRGLGGDMPTGTISLDITPQEDEPKWPYEPRMHITLPSEAPRVLAGPDEEPLNGWSRLGTNLVVAYRYPAEITPPRATFLEQRGLPADPLRHITYMPHLLALHSPLR